MDRPVGTVRVTLGAKGSVKLGAKSAITQISGAAAPLAAPRCSPAAAVLPVHRRKGLWDSSGNPWCFPDLEQAGEILLTRSSQLELTYNCSLEG